MTTDTKVEMALGMIPLIFYLASLGILLELFWPVNNEPPYGRLIKPGGTEFYKPMNWQHSTMYFFFLLYGSCRLLNARFMLLKGNFSLQ